MKRFTIALLAVLMMGGVASASLIGLESGPNIRQQANSVDAFKFLADSTFTAEIMGASFADINGGGTLRMAIYADDHELDVPGTLLSDTGEIAIANGLNTIALNSTVDIVAGQHYWLAGWLEKTTAGGQNPRWSAINHDTRPRLRAEPAWGSLAAGDPFPTSDAFAVDNAVTYAIYAAAPEPATLVLLGLGGLVLLKTQSITLYSNSNRSQCVDG